LRSVFVALFISASALGAGTKYRLPVDSERSKVEFLAVGNPSAIKIRGELKGDPKPALSGEFRIEEFKARGQVTAKLDAFETGIALRDRHMKEKYLETAKYPEAKLEVAELIVPRSFAEDGFSAEAETFKGTLTLRERTVPVAGTVSMKGSKSDMEMKFDFKVKTSDFKIETPSFMGVTVAEEVSVTAHAKIKPEILP
jgi:polyisoprenoid-binding protein YceI